MGCFHYLISAKDDVFITKKAGDDTSDEEKEWLNALESGTLDDNGEVKKERDVSMLTARQVTQVAHCHTLSVLFSKIGRAHV